MSREGSTTGLTSVVRSVSGSRTLRNRRALVVGGGHVGRTIASHLDDAYHVAFVSRNRQVVERTARDGLTTHYAGEIDANTLDEAGADGVSLAVVASADDGVNLLAAQLLRARFDVDDVIIRVDDREKLESFDDLDVETMSVSELMVDELSKRLKPVEERNI